MTDINNKDYYGVQDGSSSLSEDQWHINYTQRHAFRIYSDFDSVDEDNRRILTEAADPQTNVVDEFTSGASDKVFVQTKIVNDNAGGENIELNLDDRILTILMDQSGSMTWNDNEGLRHDVAERVVYRLSSTYPGDLKYNLIQFNGKPINTTIFAVKENDKIDVNNVQSLATRFFRDEESRFAGARVVRREGTYPTSPLDGAVVSEGFLSKSFDDGLTEGTEYFYKVFTFDKNGTFSNGVPVSGVPRNRIIPRGVSQFDATVLTGTGVSIDDNVIGAWHFDEGSGTISFDFTNNSNNLISLETEPIWYNPEDVPIGVSGARYNGSTSGYVTNGGSSNLALSSGNDMTIMFWIYPFTATVNEAVIERTASVDGTTDVNYFVGRTPTGQVIVGVESDPSLFISTATPLAVNAWHHVTVTFTETAVPNEWSISLYIDGSFLESGTQTLSSAPIDDDIAMDLSIGHHYATGSAALGSVGNFFGRITEVSIHNVIRSAVYIETAAEVFVPTSIFGADQEHITRQDQDNSDRLFVLRYEVPNDFNYSGGEVRIIRKTQKYPSHENDGDIVVAETATVGEHFITDSFPVVFGETYFYRIFSKNFIGNYSYLTDSPLAKIKIPEASDYLISTLDDLSPDLLTVSGLSTTPGNRKIWIEWLNPTLEDRFALVKVYYADDGFPVIEDGEVSSGELIFSGTLNEESYVHRNINNAEGAFYTVVVTDRFGRISNTANVSEIPSNSVDESSIPLLDVENVHYEVANNQALTIKWDNPIEFTADIEGFFDDTILVYAALTDEFGESISDDTNITMRVTSILGTSTQADDVFGTTRPVKIEVNDTYTFAVANPSNGIIKGTLKMNGDINVLSQMELVDFEIQVFAFVPDTTSELLKNGKYSKNLFEFLSKSVTIRLRNPWFVKLTNRDEKIISHLCRVQSDIFAFTTFVDDDIKIEKKIFDGAYIRGTSPFYARVEVKWKDLPLNSASTVSARIYDATMNLCDDLKKNKPSRLGLSSTVVTPQRSFPIQRGTIDVLDSKGEPTGSTREISFVDIPISPPNQPQAAYLIVQSRYGGYVSTQEMYLVFQNILQIELDAEAPVGDGVDISEQRASIYIINPDFPEDITKRTTVPDLTTVRWRLVVSDFGRNDIPFYSTDNVPATNGVFSYARGGSSRNIFVGPTRAIIHIIATPAGPVLSGEKYKISSTIVYDGLTATDEALLEVLPPGHKNRFGSRFLMEFPKYKNELWSDGEDYEKLIITHDANSSITKYSGCFRSCALSFGNDVIPLVANQIVGIFFPEGWEAIWGDVTEVVDPYTGKTTLQIGPDAEIYPAVNGTGSAQVSIMEDQDSTPVYFRVNKYYPPVQVVLSAQDLISATFLNPCECLGILGDKLQPYEESISGASTILIDESTYSIYGGGRIASGVPPTILVPKEPLNVKIVDRRVNGVPSNTVVFDGESVNQLIVEVSFAGNPVPDGTPLSVFTTDSNGFFVIPEDKVIYTETRIEELIDPNNARSYATISLKPIVPVEEFTETIVVTSNYNKIGDVERLMADCLTISYSPDDPSDEIQDIFSGQLDRYDIDSDSWVNLDSMQNPRGDVIFEAVNGKIYAIGGLSRSTVSSINEEYDPLTGDWSAKEIMPTSRFSAVSVVFDSKIYVIGGIEIDNDSSDLNVSRALERYDPVTDEWDVLTNMPSIDVGEVDEFTYGVAFGVAEYANVGGNDRIYVLCGVREIDSNGRPSQYNDRVLYYDIGTDTWFYSSVLSDEDLTSYQRIAPQGFVRSSDSNLYVVGGLFSPVDKQPDSTMARQQSILLKDAFSINVTTLALTVSDGEFYDLPEPRFRAATVKFSDDVYFVGGGNDRSLFRRTFEKIDTSSDPMDKSVLTSIPHGRSSVGVAVDTDDYGDHIYIVGGYQSGRSAGFLQIGVTSLSSSDSLADSLLGDGNWFRLDGKATASVLLNLKDQYGDPPDSDVTVVARGYLVLLDDKGKAINGLPGSKFIDGNEKYKTAAEKLRNDTLIYPVLFAQNEIVVSGGSDIVTLLSRSDDLLASLKDIADVLGLSSQDIGINISDKVEHGLLIKSGVVRRPYDIFVQLTVVDDTYFGQTVNNIPDISGGAGGTLDDEQNSRGTDLSIIPEIGDGIRCVKVYGTNTWKGYSRGDDISRSGTLTKALTALEDGISGFLFDLVPPAIGQVSSPVFNSYVDIDWVPQVDNIIDDNSTSAADVIEQIDILRNSIPFGASALFDAMVNASDLLVDESLDNIYKHIYIYTDNESNMSAVTADEALEAIQSIDGERKVSLVVGNYSIVSPVTLSAKANRSDTESLDYIASQTGGQTITVLSAEFEDDIVNIMIGRVSGSMGFGSADFVIDLGQSSVLDTIRSYFDLPTNTNSNWSVQFSEDGYNFVNGTDQLKPEVELDVSDITARYLKFHIELLTGFSNFTDEVYEVVPTASSPSLTHITISYGEPKDTELFFNTETALTVPQQVVVSVNSNNLTTNIIQSGVSQTNSHQWQDFFSGSKRIMGKDGKMLLPIRVSNNEPIVGPEPLVKVDRLTYRVAQGKWEPGAIIKILDSNNNIILDSSYQLFPRKGLIVFSEPPSGSMTAQIEFGNTLRVGVKFLNMNPNQSIEIDGIGYMYNTNVNLLPPAEKIAPIAQNLIITPSELHLFDKITASYEFIDANNDEEDTDETKIKWYINNVYISYLDGLLIWNDIDNRSDLLYTRAFSFDPDALDENETVLLTARRLGQSILKAGDQLYFTVEPSDGQLFGDVVKSEVMTVYEDNPLIDQIVIRGLDRNSKLKNTITAADSAVLQFNIVADTGSNNSVVIWYVNDEVFKNGTINEDGMNKITSGEEIGGVIALKMNNEIRVEVTPQTDGAIGETVSSASVLIGNAKPKVLIAVISPSVPSASQNLSLVYQFEDADIQISLDLNQDNLSVVKWYKSVLSSSSGFLEIESLRGKTSVPSSSTSRGEFWKAEVTPYDGIDFNDPVSSNVVLIR